MRRAGASYPRLWKSPRHVEDGSKGTDGRGSEFLGGSPLDHTQQREHDDHDNHYDHDPDYPLRIHLFDSLRKGAGLISPAVSYKAITVTDLRC